MITTYASVPAGFTVYSDVNFMQFPAGEQHFTLGPAAQQQVPVRVLITGTDANDYIRAGLWIDYAHQHGNKVEAVIPYLPAARADRGEPFGAKVYANLINSLEADQVTCLDPHSPVMTELVDNLTIVEAAGVIAADPRIAQRRYAGVIAPDAGAVARAQKAADALGIPLFRAAKHRDFATGKLSGFSCEQLPDNGRLLVVDDICDGGGTFRGLAQSTGLGPDRLDLWVSHGVFSGQAARLRENFGSIFTTDSHPGHQNPYVNATIIPVSSFMF